MKMGDGDSNQGSTVPKESAKAVTVTERPYTHAAEKGREGGVPAGNRRLDFECK